MQDERNEHEPHDETGVVDDGDERRAGQAARFGNRPGSGVAAGRATDREHTYPGRSDLGAHLILLSALLLIPAAIALAGLVGARHRRLALFGGTLAVAGAVGLAATAVASLIAGQMSRVDNRGAMVELEDRILSEPPMQVFPLLLAAGAVGSVALAVGLYRSRAVPRPAAVIVGLGGATTMLTAAGPVRAAVVAASVLALAGFAWVASTTRNDPAGRFTRPTVSTPLNVTS